MEVALTFMEGLAEWSKFAFETASILVTVVGGIVFLAAVLRPSPSSRPLVAARHRLAGFLLVALELQLAADIISTAVAPSWEQLGKLGAVAAIRTFLNFFLTREVVALEEEEAAAVAAVTSS